MQKLLFYPQINFPNSKWSVRTFLYWDNVGIIVPDIRDNQIIDDFTKTLIDINFIHKVDPYSISNFNKYQESLRTVIFSDNNLIRDSILNFKKSNYVKIHSRKFDYHLFKELEIIGVAKNINNSDWYYVEKNLGSLMMNFLTTTLSFEHDYIPTTDSPLNLRIEYNSVLNDVQYNSRNIKHAVRSKILDELMPYPIDFDITKLRKFKEKYQSDLINFRNHIENIVFKISIITDENQRDFLLNNEVLEINNKKVELFNKMKVFNLSKIVFGGACGLVATAIPLISDPSFPQIPAFVYGIYSLYNEINRPKINNPIKYLALTDKINN
jgi:hypothetical protein